MKNPALLLVVAGTLALACGGFTDTQAAHEAQLGPIGVSLDENYMVSIPVRVSMIRSEAFFSRSIGKI